MTLVALVVLIGTIVVGGITGIVALIWAERNAQFTNVSAGAYTIFEDREPIGTHRDLIWEPDPPSSSETETTSS